jgi:hypothetical protein
MPTRLSLRIRFERRSDLISLLSLIVLVAVFLVSLGLGSGAAASPSRSAPASPSLQLQRKFYLTPSLVSAVDVLAACAPGYHMASLWEIWDTSNLEYNTTLGYTWAGDQGSGPPTYYGGDHISGWVRTGAEASHIATPGLGNCDSWSGNIPGTYGTVVYLDSDWTALEGWLATIADCSYLQRLWCVADIVGERLYLPAIMRSP